jgi:hypothetical protein
MRLGHETSSWGVCALARQIQGAATCQGRTKNQISRTNIPTTDFTECTDKKTLIRVFRVIRGFLLAALMMAGVLLPAKEEPRTKFQEPIGENILWLLVLGNWFFLLAGTSSASTDDRMDHLAMDIRQAKVAPAVAVGELFVVDAKEVEYGRV